jgi:predicted transcriptional regulator YdeE
MEPKLLIKPEIKLIGIEVRTINREEMDPSTAKIPGLWGRLFQEKIAERIPNKKTDGHLLGTYTKYESDHTGPYSLIVGLEVDNLESIPSGMTGLTIPAGLYLVFTTQGPMPKALIDTWVCIWNYFPKESSHMRLYTTDYEVHHGNDKVEIHIAVK